ncbi:hypothetical protein MNQ98_29240 [Paenibacillus sp. N3/727]|nr:hypothetical protein [Paenibacillus sp. N3/727]UNK21443.1 hypothetical protein MNQ98_29240 [Paenibacillus sp. N3/727]
MASVCVEEGVYLLHQISDKSPGAARGF